MAYTSTENLENRLGAPLTTEQAAYFTDILSPAIDDYIDTQTDTTFGSTEVVTYYVNGDDSNMLSIPTMHDVTLLQNDGQAVTSTDYLLYPQGSPNKLAIRNLNGTWSAGFEKYAITGIRGYKDVPADITLVATELAVNAISSSTSNIKSEKTGDWSITYSDAEKKLSDKSVDILKSYRRLSRSI